jgi:type II secretory pathway pseudopilin PulG
MGLLLSIKNKMKHKNGFLILEILLVMGLLAIILPALLTGLYTARSGKAQQDQRVKAVSVLKEAQEAVKNVRNQDWATFAVNGTFHPLVNSGNWTLVSGATTVGDFTESVVVSDTNRDTNGNIVTSGGTVDPSTKKVVITVTWAVPYSSSMSSILYLTRHSNVGYEETIQAQFNASSATRTDVKVQASSSQPTPTPDDGEIVLSQTGGFGDWCNPAGPVKEFALAGGSGNVVPFAVSANQGSGNIISTVAEGANNSGIPLEGLSITDPAYPTPPAVTQSGTFNTSQIKTYGIYNEVNYGYLATQKSGTNRQGVIINLSNYTQNASLDIGTSTNGQSIFVANNYAYLTTDNNKLYIFDISNKTLSSHSPVSGGVVSLAGLGVKVVVIGTKAYVATSSTSTQLQIIDVSNPGSPGTPVNISVGNNKGATDVYLNQTQLRAYLVTSYANSTTPDFFSIDVNPADGTWYQHVVSTYITQDSMNPTGVIAVSGARGIIVGTGSTKNYQVIALSDENYPTPAVLSSCGPGLTTSYNINAITTLFTSATRAYSYIVTTDPGKEYKIVEGGPGAGNGSYISNGTFISQPFGPTSYSTTFNGFVADINQPVVNVGSGFYGVKIQVAAASPDGNGTCINSDYSSFIGTDSTGTGTTHYFTTSSIGPTTISGVIPVNTYSTYSNPNKCFKYKVLLNTNDSTLTPVFKDITINYSP